jgi:hypothetical protein
VTPHVFIENKLEFDLSLVPGEPPLNQTNTGRAAEILTDGLTDVSSETVSYDFWNKSERYVDINADFGDRAYAQSFILYGANPHSGQYAVSDCTAKLILPDGGKVNLKVDYQTMNHGHWKAVFSTLSPVLAEKLVIRCGVGRIRQWKMAFTELSVYGKPASAGGFTVNGPQIKGVWRDFKGGVISGEFPLTPCLPNTVSAGDSPAVGYYGLNLAVEDENCRFFDGFAPGETKEYGFAVLPQKDAAARVFNENTFFGMAHAPYTDPYIAGYSKTQTWMRTNFDADGWRDKIAAAREYGLEEEIICTGEPWAWDDSEPITQNRLDELYSLLLQHFQADPTVKYWELGREENISSTGNYRKEYYWDNLEAKARAAANARDDAGAADIKLVYQIVGIAPTVADNFLNHAASRYFDVISIHPYDWNNNAVFNTFRDPESNGWFTNMVAGINAKLAAVGRTGMEIEFSEIGAPHQEIFTPGAYRYPNVITYGISRAKGARITAKYNIYASQSGVKKSVWYHYSDWFPDKTYPENDFGMLDFWGFPKPMYLAYANCVSNLEGKAPSGMFDAPNGVKYAVYTGENGDCAAAWAELGETAFTAWADLGVDPQKITAVTNTVGAPLAWDASGIDVSEYPVYVLFK